MIGKRRLQTLLMVRGIYTNDGKKLRSYTQKVYFVHRMRLEITNSYNESDPFRVCCIAERRLGFMVPLVNNAFEWRASDVTVGATTTGCDCSSARIAAWTTDRVSANARGRPP
jgi:hypothetical protein